MKSPILLLVLVACLKVPFADAGERLPDVTYTISGIEFKENGRIDLTITSVCDVKKMLVDAASHLYADTEKRKMTAKKSDKSNYAHYDLELQVDRVTRLAWGSFGAAWGGAEIGVSALLPTRDTKKQSFLCRADFGSGGTVKASQCQRLEFCGKKIAKDIEAWLRLQPVTQSK